MGLVVDLGLERFEPLEAIEILEKLVAERYTTAIREVFGGKVLEVSANEPSSKDDRPRPRSRWLSDKEAKPILQAIAKLYKAHGTYASFSWSELEEVGANDVQAFAIVRDGAAPSFYEGIEVDSHRFGVVDIDKSSRNWRGTRGNVGMAAKLHALAKKHRLLVHSA